MMKMRYIILSVTALLLTAILLTACERSGNDLAPYGQQQPDNTLRIVASKQPVTDENGTRATTDLGGTYATTFGNGDEIGIIAVKDGAVLDDCNNLKLTYNATGGKWEGNNIFFLEDATYIAYSPYNASMDGKKSLDEVYNSFVVPTDQSTDKKFASADLLTSTTCTADKAAKTLSIVFEHRMAIIRCEKTYTQKMYAKTEISGYIYEIATSNLQTGTFQINGHTDYYSSGSFYYYIVKPSDKPTLTATYSLKGGAKTCDCSGSVQSLTAGTYKTIRLLKKRNLQIGDYYYKNGSVYPTEAGAPPTTDCVGIIYQTEANPDRISPEEKSQGWSHALVISNDWAFKDQRYTWSTVEEVTSAVGTYMMDTGIADIFGYKQTLALFNLGQTNGNYAGWKNRLISPEGEMVGRRSPWYVPGMGQWADVLDNLTTASNKNLKDRCSEFEDKIKTSGGTFFGNGANLNQYYYDVYASSQYNAQSVNGPSLGYENYNYGGMAIYWFTVIKNGGPYKCKAPNYPYNFGGAIWVYGCSF